MSFLKMLNVLVNRTVKDMNRYIYLPNMTLGSHYNRMPKKQLSAGFPVSYNKPNNVNLKTAENRQNLCSYNSGLSASIGTVVVGCDPHILSPCFLRNLIRMLFVFEIFCQYIL